MKNAVFIIVIAALLGAFFYFFSDSAPTITNYPPKNQTIVAFGDSLIAGEGAAEDKSFISLLSEKLDRPIENLGVNGNTSADGLARIEDVVARDPGLVIVSLGGNDYLRRMPESETSENLRAIIERLHAEGSVVMLLGVRGGILRDSRSSMYEELSREYGTAYVSDILDGLIGDPEFMDDAIHPNDRGHAIIAERIHEALIELGYGSQ